MSTIKSDDTNEAAIGSLAAASQDHPEEELLRDEDVDSDRNFVADQEEEEEEEEEEETTKCTRLCERIGLKCCCRLVTKWPRTSALTFGVVVPLFFLIAVSVFFGYFLAQLEGPGEVANNNDVISTRVALALQDQVMGNITENLPHLCLCTYLTEKKFQDIFDKEMQRYEQCLEEQTLQRMPSSNPSFQPSSQPSFIPSLNPNSTNVTLIFNGTDDSASALPIIDSNLMISSNNSAGATNITESNNTTDNEPIIVCVEPKSLRNSVIEFAIQRVFISQFKSCLDNPRNISADPVGSGEVCTKTGEKAKFEDIEVSTEDLLMEMKNCGKEALNIAERYMLTSVITKSLSDATPSYNWNRCALRNATGEQDLSEKTVMNLNQLFNPFVNASYLHPSSQDEEAASAWIESQQELYCQYVADGLAIPDALEKSFEDANGFEDEDCVPNMWAGAWFWFTIMTTIGYGNTAPTTDGGRIMIFTLGFVSILCFGTVLRKAGSIVVAIVEDFLLRTHFSFLTRNWIQTIVWGGLYYLWSLLIASYYVYWNQMRLGETVSLNDAYWYAYITTTTVGLGDYYLEHAAIIGIDLLIWPLLILYGFVLLAAFLTALGALVQSVDDDSDFADKLAAQQSLFSCFPNWFQRDAKIDLADQNDKNALKFESDLDVMNNADNS